MSKRKKNSILITLLICQRLFAWDFDYADNESDTLYNGTYQQRKTENGVSALIGYYQQRVSPLQGSRCPCFPSCSDFTGYAMDKYGMVTGFLMGLERIFIREQGLLFTADYYSSIERFSINHQLKSGFYDLPEANNIFLKKDWRCMSPDFYNVSSAEIR